MAPAHDHEPPAHAPFTAALEPEPHLLDAPMPGQRVIAGSEAVDLGEQVIGSEHWFDAVHLHLANGFRGQATLIGAISDASFHPRAGEGPSSEVAAVEAPRMHAFTPETGPGATPLIRKTDALQPIRIKFAPQHAGSYRATLSYSAYWSDGVVTKHRVVVSARARGLTEVPHDPLRAATPTAVEGLETSSPVTPRTDRADAAQRFETATAMARDSAAGLAEAQKDGVRLAKDDADAFKATVPKAAWWTELAEIAISMGVAGIAGIVARHLGHKIASVVHANLDGTAVKNTRVFLGATDALKDGLKRAGKEVAAPIAPIVDKVIKPDDSRPAPAAADGALSTNPVNAFWAEQHQRLQQVAMANRRLITSLHGRLAPTLATAPATAAATMEGLAEVIESARTAHALKKQAFASQTQWVAGIAQANLGHEEVQGPGMTTPRSVTALDGVHWKRLYGKHNGLLELAVTLAAGAREIEPGAVNVTHASLRGIAQEVADQLWTQPLGGVPLPVRIAVTTVGMEATITRDEVGRIRMTGLIPNPDHARTEVQQLQSATILCDLVLSKSLQAWGLPEIATNDSTGRNS